MVIRKAAVHLEEQFGGLAIEPLEQAMHHRTTRAVAGVDDHPNAPREMELRGDLIHVGLRDVRAFDAARTGEEVAPLDQAPDLLYLFAMNGGSPAHDLEAVVLRWIVAAGDHDAGVRLQVKDGIVKQRRGRHADIADLAAAGLQAAHQGVAQALGAEAAIAAQIDPAARMPPQISTGGAAEHLDIDVAQFRVGDAADIVLAKDSRIGHQARVYRVARGLMRAVERPAGFAWLRSRRPQPAGNVLAI